MPRETLDRKIKHLIDGVLILDSMVEKAILESVDALKRRDLEKAHEVYEFDQKVNEKRFELENDTITTIATQQPIMGADLRLLASILEVTGELERMGDYAKGIAHITMMLGDQQQFNLLADIPRMAELSVGMLHEAIGAFVARDAQTAQAIPERDDEIDDLYNQVYRELVSIMLSDPSTIDRANLLMWAAHNLERVADRVTNICERTIYVASGYMEEIDVTDDESIPKHLG